MSDAYAEFLEGRLEGARQDLARMKRAADSWEVQAHLANRRAYTNLERALKAEGEVRALTAARAELLDLLDHASGRVRAVLGRQA